MRLIFKIIFLIIPSINAGVFTFAQEVHTVARINANQTLDYYRLLSNKILIKPTTIDVSQKYKCRFWIQAQVLNNWNEFTIAQKIELSTLMQANIMQSGAVIGRFRIHYDTSGSKAPSLLDKYGNPIPNSWKNYVDSVGKIFNEVWDYQINRLGFAQPPLDAEQLYDIYIDSLSESEYGATIFNPSEPLNPGEQPERFSSYILIDNDYNIAKRYTVGMNALKVTAAHEFSHAIQIGAYGLRDEDIHAHEITSTWLEDVIYDEVNDYYQYLKDYFGDSKRQLGFWQGLPFNSCNFFIGYERAIWGHYTSKRFEPIFMRKVWEQMRNYSFLASTEIVLQTYGSDLKSSFAEFAKWNYYTADRAIIDTYYPEGNKYPQFQPLQQTIFNTSEFKMTADVYPLSSSFYEFAVGGNSVTVVIANVNTTSAEQYSLTRFPLDVTLTKNLISAPYWEVTSGLKLKIEYSDSPSNWLAFVMQKTKQPDAAPNPFRLSQDQKLFLPVNEDKAQVADVFIYNSAFDLAFSGQFRTSFNETGGTRVIEIPASLLKSILSSGVYFIFASTVNAKHKWKVAMIR